jgi:putative ABC transport system permease protein
VLITVALRNLTRRKSRSVLLAITVAIGVFMMLSAIGYNRGVARQMTDMVVQGFTGDLLVLPDGLKTYDVFKPAKPNSPVIDAIADLQARFRQDPNVLAVSPHNRVGGLLQSSERDQGVILVGVNPSVEPQFNTQITVNTGEPLSASDPHGILVPDKTAQELNLRIGDSVNWVSSSRSGHVHDITLTVRGLFRASPYAGSTIYATLSASQEMLGLNASQAQEVLVILKDRDQLEGTRQRLAAVGAGPGQKVVVHTWQEQAGFFTGLVLGNGVSLGIMVAILFIAILIGLVNAVVMTIKERTGEIGAMMAMGTPPARIVQILLLEQFCLTEGAVLVASAIGYGLITWLGHVGIPAPNTAMQFAFGGERLHPVLSLVHVLMAFLISGGAALIATLLAGISILRLKPVDALRELT